MTSRVFALIIGIDKYISKKVSNLSACVSDALRIRDWLVDGLEVPAENTCLLLNEQATKQNIETTFMTHLISNAQIERGDAILVYFAGHGSSVAAPDGWSNGDVERVELLCTHDYDTIPEGSTDGGRVSGLTDWSLNAMLRELCASKGDNVIVILDCCFNPVRDKLKQRRPRPGNNRRRSIRWTSMSDELTTEDLYAGLWPSALADGADRTTTSQGQNRGFAQEAAPYVTLLACSPGERAMEDHKLGGRLTSAFLEAIEEDVSLHQTSYFDLVFNLYIANGSQHAVCTGQHRGRKFFDGVPFVEDGRFVAAVRVEDHVRIEAGAIHGMVMNTGFTLHDHNLRGSLNPILASLVAFEVHPTWCLARPSGTVPIRRTIGKGWVRVVRWGGGESALRVSLKRKLPVPLPWRLWKRHRNLSRTIQGGWTVSGYGVQRSTRQASSDISLRVTSKAVVVEDRRLLSAGPDEVDEERELAPVNAPAADKRHDDHLLDAIASFHYHLSRRPADDSSSPFRDEVRLKVLRKTSTNTETPALTKVLTAEQASIRGQSTVYVEAGATYTLMLDNQSDFDLWPYIFWMDADTYSCTCVYLPHQTSTGAPPLLSKTEMKVPSGRTGSPQLADVTLDGTTRRTGTGTGFFKVFLSTTFVPNMRILELNVGSGLPTSGSDTRGGNGRSRDGSEIDRESREEKRSSNLQDIWDTLLVEVVIDPSRKRRGINHARTA